MTNEGELIRFAKHLRSLIKAKGISQNEFARRAGMSQAVVSRIVSGTREINMEHAVRIAGVLEITTRELVFGTTAASVLSDWIPTAEFTRLEHERVAVCRELELARAEIAAKNAEISSLKSSLRASEARTAESNVALAEMRAYVARTKIGP